MEHPFLLDSDESIRREQASFMNKVYSWMSLALVITAIVAVYTASSRELMQLIFGTPFLLIGLVIGEIFLVGWLAVAVMRMSVTQATAVFLGYAALNGLTLSAIFIKYTAASIGSTFFITAGMFGITSLYGYFTKRDLTSWGNLLFMAVIGLLLATIVNVFWANSMLYWITTYAGILIFVGLTAYDTQKIKNMNIIGNEGTDEDRKEAIRGALTLYLDFINLFIYLLRLFGARRN
jgi:FtsH-binding integral membrane protein